MKKWTLLEETTGPNGSKITLHSHDSDYAIRVNGRELMSSRHHYSEEQLAQVACSPFGGKMRAHVLIGGLGLGFTLRKALSLLGPDSRVTVAEILPEIVTWNQNPAYQLAGDSLADPRTQVEMGDVAEIIKKNSSAFDAIMLDADNETTAMNTSGNSSLYESHGLAQVYQALRPHGVAVYWSAGADPHFAKKMGRSGFKVETQRARISPTSNGAHFLYIGRRS